MTKTLDDAIGYWTVNPDYNGLVQIAGLITNAARWCRAITLKNDPQKLMRDLELLKARTNTMTELVDDAIKRCREIIETDELKG